MNKLLIPPPGPLCWLFPELEVLEPQHKDASHLPIPLLDEEHLEQISRARSIEVPAGPRGETVGRILREQVRHDTPRFQAVEKPWSLERRLTRIAEGHPAGSMLLVRGQSVSVIPLSDLVPPVVSSSTTPGESEELRLLPIALDHPVETIRQVLKEIVHWQDQMPRVGLVPYFLNGESSGLSSNPESMVHTRMAMTFWGLFPGEVYDDELRGLHHELIKILHPDRYLRFLAFENHALAGFDLYDEALRGRELRPIKLKEKPAKQSERAMVIAIDGIDGAGKSTQLLALKKFLEGKGLRCAIHKIYRHGVFHDTVTDLTRRCAGDQNLHLWRIQRIAKVFDSLKYYFSSIEEDLERYDVLLFDRYLGTHFAAGLGRYHHDPYARELLSLFPAADQVYLLDLNVDTALDRIATRTVRTVDENPYMLTQYRNTLLALAREEGWVVLDAEQDETEICSRIHSDVESLLDRAQR